MGGNKKGHSYGTSADLQLLVSGVDDIPSGKKIGKLSNVQQGSRLHCIVVLRTDELPPYPALIKLKLKSKFLCRKQREEYRNYGEPEGAETITYFEKEKWFEHVIRCSVMPVPGTGTLEERSGKYRIDYPLVFDVPDSKSESMEGDFPYRKARVWYKVRVKVSFEGYPQRFKSKLEDIDVIRRAPTHEELCKSVKEEKGKKRNWCDLSMGKFKAKAFSDAFVYAEGDWINVVAHIENNSGKTVDDGEISVVREAEYNTIHQQFGPRKNPGKLHKDVVTQKLREMKLRHKTNATRTFVLRLPESVEPRTACLKKGDYYFSFSHYFKLRFAIPGEDLRLRIPIDIAANPSRALYSPPVFPNQPPPPRYSALRSQPYFLVHVKGASGLPKMDGRFGKADPFATILINDKHFLCTAYISKTLDPVWDETFQVAMTPEELSIQSRMHVCVYDYDMIGDNDLVGEVEGGILPSPENRGELQLYQLKKTKKGITRNRGQIQLSYAWV